MTPSWYDVLDVETSATTDEVRTAWRTGIADLEPGSRRFQTLNSAAEVLLDEQSRAAYDAELAAQQPEPGPEAASLEPHDERQSVEAEQQTGLEVGRGPSRAISTWALAVLGVVVAAAVAAALWAWQLGDDADVEEATTAAQSAAERAVEPLLSYDHETLEEDKQRSLPYLTDDYREKYDQVFAVIEDNAASVQPKVVADAFASAIVRSGEERVQVLLFVDQLTTNKAMTAPVTYKNQVTVTMEKVGDAWLVDDLSTSLPTG